MICKWKKVSNTKQNATASKSNATHIHIFYTLTSAPEVGFVMRWWVKLSAPPRARNCLNALRTSKAEVQWVRMKQDEMMVMLVFSASKNLSAEAFCSSSPVACEG